MEIFYLFSNVEEKFNQIYVLHEGKFYYFDNTQPTSCLFLEVNTL